MMGQKYKNLTIILFLSNLSRVINLVMENQFEKKPNKHHHIEEVQDDHHQLEEIPNGHHQLDDSDYEWNDWDEWEEYYHDKKLMDEEGIAKGNKLYTLIFIFGFIILLVMCFMYQ
jgi:hypothetical protein